jgi:membrane protein implicated in regulation of membrane protease activity
MPEWLAQVSAFGVFLSIAAFGFLFLLISLLFGEISDAFGGHDSDGGADADHGGPGFFSTRILSVFVTAFGGFGAVATHYGLTPLPASGVGFLSGVVFSVAVYLFARFLYSQQSSIEIQTADLVGQTARVVVAIPADGVGQVRCRVGEELIDKIARSRDGVAIPDNAVVKIEEILGDTVVVSRL